jgi:hypothetical protein
MTPFEKRVSDALAKGLDQDDYDKAVTLFAPASGNETPQEQQQRAWSCVFNALEEHDFGWRRRNAANGASGISMAVAAIKEMADGSAIVIDLAEVARRTPKRFNPAFEMPRNADEAMAVLDEWGKETTYTFSAARAKKIADILHYERGVRVDRALEDHQIALIVNQLRDTAIDYHSTQQLRDRIAHIIVPYLKKE